MLIPILLASLGSVASADEDLRSSYDVQTYRLDIDVNPDDHTVRGTSAIEFQVTADKLETFVADLWSGDDDQAGLKVDGVFLLQGELSPLGELTGEELRFEHENDQVRCHLDLGLAKGSKATIAIQYSGTPGRESDFTGFHWEETADGSPWIGTSCQGTGAHWWWPCKASYYHPEDKHELLCVNATVPKGLYAVSNGRLQSRSEGEKTETFHWRNDYGCETYAVTLNIAPYVVVESQLTVPGLEDKVPFIYYVLPENAEKAKVQFSQVPELVGVFSEVFGPYPFPNAKFGLVETSFWGMEHSTAVAYGSSYPLWCQQTGAKDRYAGRNRFFDYILVHEVAHEWWGNAVSASDWGHFWIHEGFGTYAEGVYVERTQGREVADQYFSKIRSRPDSNQSLYRGENKNSGEAYSGLIYSKGALVLNTLRHFVANDDAWWKSLREFNMTYRGRNATTEDFRAILERNTGQEWKQFFDEWFYGAGLPTLKGEVRAEGNKLIYDIENPTDDVRTFHIPLKVSFKLNGQASSLRVELAPGANQREIQLPGPVTDIELPTLHRIAGNHRVKVKS